ncbi:MAG: protein phosphatase 2C domain-containing protein [Gammaproteobacteria bacterium]
MSTALFAGIDMPAPELIPIAGGLACVHTERRPGRETANEDAAVVIPGAGGCCVLGVADGLGGLPAGDMASRMVLQELADRSAGQAGDVQREAVLSALEQASEAIQASGQGGATTVAVAAIDGNTVRTSLVGDSMVVVCGQRGKIKYRSLAHSPVGYAEASGMLDEAEAMFHEERHLVSNVIGMQGMHVEVGPLLQLAARDTVILGSDGLFDNLYVSEVVELVRCGSLTDVGGRLLDACRRRMQDVSGEGPHKPDDLTFILYRQTV